MCRVGSLGWALGLRKKKETVSILSLCPHRTKESMKLRGTDTPESAQPVRGRAGISAQACVTPGPCFHLPSAQPSLRVVGEERMCVTPLQEFLCGSYPPDLIVSLLRIGTLLLTSVSPKKQRRQWPPLQCPCLENPMDGGAWWAAVHGVAKSWTRLSDITFPFHFHALEKAMATHSSVLAWRVPGTGEPGGQPSTGSHRVGHD